MKLLKKLYTFDAHSGSSDMRHFANEVKKLCLQRGAKVTKDKHGNLYVVKGESDTYPCIASHLDEVHDRRGEGFKVIEYKGVISGFSLKSRKTHGIGADDKNGIWVALRCLEQFDVLKCAFFVDEEIGCLGSSAADMSFFDDCRFVLQIDRKNNSDFITTISGGELCSEEFIKAVNPSKYKYKETYGLMTDVQALKRNGLKVSACNMSCGYYNPHTSDEYTVFADLKKCLKFVTHIIKDCTDVYPHEYKQSTYARTCYSSRYYGYYDDFDWDGLYKKQSERAAAVKTTDEIEQQLLESTTLIDPRAETEEEDDFGIFTASIYNLDEYTLEEVEEVILTNPTLSVQSMNNKLLQILGFKLEEEDLSDIMVDVFSRVDHSLAVDR